jgi:phosphoribosylglycinamide formyltransferase-1
MINIAIFASGSGSNAENIIRYFKKEANVRFYIISDKEEAFVHQRAEGLGVPSITFSPSQFRQSKDIIKYLQGKNISFIVLAGFLLKVSDDILDLYPNRIINIHPSLLPKFGGKGMYGSRVHQAVVDALEKESGITIHYVNNHYDEGKIIFQTRCEVFTRDTAETVAAKIHQLEEKYFPMVLKKLILGESEDNKEIILAK